MSTIFAQAVDALVHQRDLQFLERIATDYSLNLDELKSKYIDVAEAAIKVPRKYKKREAKEVKTTDESGNQTKCQGITAKKEPCKFSALKGGCFCKRHQEQNDKKDGGSPGVQSPAPAPAAVAPSPAVTEARLAALLKEVDEPVPHTGPIKIPPENYELEECSECDTESEGEGEEEYEDED